ncbi:MAG: Rrf2 family transcriptional regulator [Rectinema sp.]|nr:Rrf2 family transcriptional regulator [Rectinema sp.]
MDRILAISDTVNAAIHALTLAVRNGGRVSAREAAERLGVSYTYLSKIMQRLSNAGFLAASRGAGGGYILTRPGENITCIDILLTLEGELPMRECLFAHAVCMTGRCVLRTFCEETEQRLHQLLENTTIADIARSY